MNQSSIRISEAKFELFGINFIIQSIPSLRYRATWWWVETPNWKNNRCFTISSSHAIVSQANWFWLHFIFIHEWSKELSNLLFEADNQNLRILVLLHWKLTKMNHVTFFRSKMPIKIWVGGWSFQLSNRIILLVHDILDAGINLPFGN